MNFVINIDVLGVVIGAALMFFFGFSALDEDETVESRIRSMLYSVYFEFAVLLAAGFAGFFGFGYALMSFCIGKLAVIAATDVVAVLEDDDTDY